MRVVNSGSPPYRLERDSRAQQPGSVCPATYQFLCLSFLTCKGGVMGTVPASQDWGEN